MRTFRKLLTLVAVAAMAIPFSAASAGAATAPTTATHAPAFPVPPGIYISPWGSADVDISDATLAWMDREGVELTTIAPFEMDADGRGFHMPIGSTAGDHLDEKGRIFYPGGLRFEHMESGTTVTLRPTYIRVMPRPGWTSGVSVNGTQVTEEMPLADTKYHEVIASGRPSPTGFRLEKVPFYVTSEASDMFEEQTGAPGPRAGSLFGNLTPHFDYVPTGR